MCISALDVKTKLPASGDTSCSPAYSHLPLPTPTHSPSFIAGEEGDWEVFGGVGHLGGEVEHRRIKKECLCLLFKMEAYDHG